MESESESNPEENEREIRYAEILNRRKTSFSKAHLTGETYAIEGIVDELRSCIDVGGEGEENLQSQCILRRAMKILLKDCANRKRRLRIQTRYSFKELGRYSKSPQAACHTLDELNRSNVPRVLGDY